MTVKNMINKEFVVIQTWRLLFFFFTLRRKIRMNFSVVGKIYITSNLPFLTIFKGPIQGC